MTRRLLSILALAALLLPVPAALARGADDLPEDPRLDRPISLNLNDAEARQVLDLLFRAAMAPVEIDDCVAGRVTIEMEGVSVRDALRALARMVDVTVTASPRSTGYVVTCAPGTGGSPAAAASTEEVELRFRLVRDDDGEEHVVTSPTLLTHAGQAAEIMIGARTPRPEIDQEGRLHERKTLSQLRVKAFPHPSAADGSQVLRGVLEIAGRSSGGDGVTRVAMKGFEVTLPPDDAEVLAAEVSFDGKEHRLFVRRPRR